MPLRPIFRTPLVFRLMTYFTRFISQPHRARLPYLLLPTAFSLFYQRRDHVDATRTGPQHGKPLMLELLHCKGASRQAAMTIVV